MNRRITILLGDVPGWVPLAHLGMIVARLILIILAFAALGWQAGLIAAGLDVLAYTSGKLAGRWYGRGT